MDIAEIKDELLEFKEMLESDRDMLLKHPQQTPTHKILQNLIDDITEIIDKIDK